MIKLKDLLIEADDDSRLSTLNKRIAKLDMEEAWYVGNIEDWESEDEVKNHSKIQSALTKLRRIDNARDKLASEARAIEIRRRKAAGTWS